MKWSKQKCRNVAIIATLMYFILGVYVVINIRTIGNYVPEFVIGIFYPIIMPVYAALWGMELAFLIVPLSLFIVWLVFYGIIWLIKGEKS